MAGISNFYLFLYNSLQACGWGIAFLRTSASYASTKSFNYAYPYAGELVCFVQTSAFLEVIHGAIGIVPSGALSPLMQWGGRTHFVRAIVRQIHEVQDSPVVWLTFFTWCIGDTIRYVQHALNCIGSCPHWVTWLRYSAFMLLYPTGLVCEMWIMYQALPFIKQQNLYGEAFQIFPFGYYGFVVVVLVLYPFLWLKLFLQLVKQRKSKLGKQHKRKEK